MSLDKPEIDFPDFPVPEDLVIEDITVGTGAEAKAGQQVTVHYAGVSYSTSRGGFGSSHASSGGHGGSGE